MIEEVELGKIASFSQGQQVSIPDQRKEMFDGCDTFIRIINYTQGSSDFRYIPKQNPKYHITKHDIIMVRYGAVGFVGKGIEGVLANNMFKIDYDKQVLFGDYLFRALRSGKVQSQLISASQSTSMAALNFKTVSRVKIPLPPLETQKKIAAILDEADKLRQLDKRLIEKYDALTQSLFLDMFGDLVGEKESLSSLCEINPKKSEISNLDKSTLVSFIPMSNVSEKGEVDLSIEKTIDEVWSGFTYFAERDVVFAKITPCMENGKGAIMRSLTNGIGFGTTEFHVLRPKENKSSSEWIYHLTTSYHFRKLAENNMKGSAGQKRVPTDFFKRFKIVCPPIELQNQFAERVEAIEAQKALAQKSLEKSEELFNSLLQKAFKGELV
ncbi:type I restriction enzyme, S subunit [Arenibacter nanhaiticus]|uniref:Type I restriction enzyme, S subunit n=1 Tax=Arenibacter nanhaiticus TaxID=558155 RepID=A0A1M6KY45_9FLAO|nr:restriction endonuclease subunit S [Arenibacter nanhaiticus]SHJ63762.1 type I restriction enzyme, S subunit [Arenibacter nanhaiticus]